MEAKNSALNQQEMMTAYNFAQGADVAGDAKAEGQSSYKDWDTMEVGAWLKNQVRLPQYSKVFGKLIVVSDEKAQKIIIQIIGGSRPGGRRL